ncbi:MAG: hypothetical protein EPO61_04875 [Nitrospirae bacterium]|nr:MAG: hypothetical protein EPO61_04875 [Nitrospirota bacterium]
MFICRALEETCKALDWKNKGAYILSAFLAVPIAWFYLWFFGQGKVVFGEMNTAAAYIGALATIATFFFIGNLVRVPFLIVREKTKDIDDLTQRNALLEDKLKPRFSFLYDRDNSSYRHEGTHFKLARIGVFNESYGEPLTDVHVNLKRVAVCLSAEGKLPTPLHFKGDNKADNDPRPYKTSADINPRDELLVDVAQWQWDGQNLPKILFPSVEAQIYGDPGIYEFEIVIQVTAKNSADCMVTYKTALDGTKFILKRIP